MTSRRNDGVNPLSQISMAVHQISFDRLYLLAFVGLTDFFTANIVSVIIIVDAADVFGCDILLY